MRQKRKDVDTYVKWVGGITLLKTKKGTGSVRHGFVEDLLSGIATQQVKLRTLARKDSDTMDKIEKLSFLTPELRPPALAHGLAKMLEEFCVYS